MSAEERKRRLRFKQQKENARGRGIEFDITFEQWWAIWDKSKRWKRRGRKVGEYCMARRGDQGAYSPDNVRVVLVQKNCRGLV